MLYQMFYVTTFFYNNQKKKKKKPDNNVIIKRGQEICLWHNTQMDTQIWPQLVNKYSNLQNDINNSKIY